MKLETKLRTEDLFDSLGNEDEQEIDKSIYLRKGSNENLDKIVEGYNKFDEITRVLDIDQARINEDDEDPLYALAKILIPKEYTSRDVMEFSLSERLDAIDGYYLSALFNEGNEEKYKVFSENPISYIGWENDGKDITVIGDVGSSLGCGMISGRINIKGSVEEGIGEGMLDGRIIITGDAINQVGSGMQGGEIEVYGSVGDDLGYGMENGKIIVNGNAGSNVGLRMKNGEIIIKGNAGSGVGSLDASYPDAWEWDSEESSGKIYLEGDYGPFGKQIQCGEIYHKGKLIVKGGRIV
jgi:hypothetical protein